MTKPFLLLLMLFLGLNTSLAQTKVNVDSLKNEMNSAKLSLSEKVDMAIDLVKVYRGKQADSAVVYLKKAKLLAEQSGEVKLLAKVTLAEGNYFNYIADYEKAIQFNQKALSLFESINDLKGIADAYNSFARTYKRINGDNSNSDTFSLKALAYAKKAKEYYLQTTDTGGLILVISNIGIIYRDLKQYDEAEKAFLEGITIAKKANFDGLGLGVLKANLSQIYLDHYKNYHRAIKLLHEALENYKLNGIRPSMEHAYRNLSYNYSNLEEHDEAIKYAKMAVEIAEEVKNPHRAINAYESLYFVQKMAGEYEASLLNLEILKGLEDSLLSLDKASAIVEMDTKFDTVKKEAEIQVLTKTNELNRWRIGALLSGLVSLLFFLYYISQKRRKDKVIFEGEKALEKERFEKKELELEEKKKLLTSKVLQLASKNDFLNNLQNEVVELLKESVDSSVNKTSKRISSMIRKDMNGDKQWEQFGEEFSSIHQGFIASLAKEFGAFTKTEVRLISLLKMNLSSKEIADILSISDEGIKKARYRLRKKINLEDSELQGFLLNFS
jgi:tetratricopeptide (TPR) repeat protein